MQEPISKRTAVVMLTLVAILFGGTYAIVLAATGHVQESMQFARWAGGGLGTLTALYIVFKYLYG